MSDAYYHSQKITVEWDKTLEMWIISDEGGEFARATSAQLALPYIEQLMIGPSTTISKPV